MYRFPFVNPATISMIVSVIGVLITIATVITTNAKNQQKTESKIDVIDVKIQTLSDRVEKHNNVIERVYQLETDYKVLEQREKVSEHRLDDLEKGA